jgi:hypothetical protein
LYIHASYKNVPIVAGVITGQHLDLFLKGGATGLKLPTPFVLGKAMWDFSAYHTMWYERGNNALRRKGLSVGCAEFDEKELNVRIHLFRKTDSAMCCVCRSEGHEEKKRKPLFAHPLIEQGERITHQSKFDFSREQVGGFFGIGPFKVQAIKGLPLRQTTAAAEIRRRFPDPVDFVCYLCFEVVEGDYFAIAGIGVGALKQSKSDNNEVVQFNSHKEAKVHGVTLLHILSELQGTEFS